MLLLNDLMVVGSILRLNQELFCTRRRRFILLRRDWGDDFAGQFAVGFVLKYIAAGQPEIWWMVIALP